MVQPNVRSHFNRLHRDTMIDLATGKVLASEEPSATGFCPTGFYVPDWWDINDSSILPGSMKC